MLCIRKQNELHNLVEVEIFANELANENVLKALIINCFIVCKTSIFFFRTILFCCLF